MVERIKDISIQSNIWGKYKWSSIHKNEESFNMIDEHRNIKNVLEEKKLSMLFVSFWRKNLVSWMFGGWYNVPVTEKIYGGILDINDEGTKMNQRVNKSCEDIIGRVLKILEYLTKYLKWKKETKEPSMLSTRVLKVHENMIDRIGRNQWLRWRIVQGCWKILL